MERENGSALKPAKYSVKHKTTTTTYNKKNEGPLPVQTLEYHKRVAGFQL